MRPKVSLTPLSVDAVHYLAHDLARKVLAWDEPIPDYGSRFPNILESCLRVPLQTFGGKPLYRGLMAKAAILFYLMIKNHPFQNGNKRIAVTSLLVFLSINGYWLKLSPRELYRFAVYVAKSQPEEKDIVVAALQAYLKLHLVPFDD